MDIEEIGCIVQWIVYMDRMDCVWIVYGLYMDLYLFFSPSHISFNSPPRPEGDQMRSNDGPGPPPLNGY